MKCSHGIQFEVKCRQCFEEAMARVSASQVKPWPDRVSREARVDVLYLGDIQMGVDKSPRFVVK